MQNLPTAETYAKENQYFPWGLLVREVIAYCTANIPEHGVVLDLMCGTGNLLGTLQAARPDAAYTGVDLEPEYINYAKQTYRNVEFAVADSLAWEGPPRDVVLCTGGLHHISYDKQELLIEKIARLLKPRGFAIIADPYIGDYSSEEERRAAATELGLAYTAATAANEAPQDIMDATHIILSNDVHGIEFKTSIKKLRPVFEKHFASVEMHKTWPAAESAYGEYYFILRN